MKIPKLNYAQSRGIEIIVKYMDEMCDAEDRKNVQDIYLTCLKIADEQGLLTKEASLALKPDNWIEWEREHVNTCNHKDECTGKSKDYCFEIIIHSREHIEIYVVPIETCSDWRTYIKTLHTSNFEYKDVCQNWLNEYLKDKLDDNNQ